MRVELGDGEWAELKDIKDIRRADQKFVLKATTMELDPAAGKAYVNGANDEDQVDALLERVVTSWSLMFPVPSSDRSSLGKLTLEQGAVLTEAVKPYLELINSKTDPGKKGTDPTAG